MKPYAFHPEAAEEYEDAAHYYKAISTGLGARFFEEIERVILEIRRQPGKFFRFSLPAQRAVARKFPMHAKRRPGYWRVRP